MDATDQQCVFVPEMHVKGGSANVGAIQNLFDRDGVIALFANQRNERLTQEGLRLLNPPIGHPLYRHVTAPRTPRKDTEHTDCLVRYRTYRLWLFFNQTFFQSTLEAGQMFAFRRLSQNGRT